MIHDLKPYPAYKDSGVPWLGEVPEHWDVVPNRAFLKLKKKLVGASSANYTLLSLTKQGVIARDLENPEGKFPASFETYQEVKSGNLIFCLFDIDETPRTVGLSTLEGMITGAYTVFECTDPEAIRFIYLFYLAMDNGKHLKPLYTGLRKVITKSTFLSAKMPLPPSDEQSAINRYLDYIDRRIRRYIRTKQKLIKLLEEQKQVIIHQAVTRGLDPNVKLKSSGVEWLGEVPEHWEVRKLKFEIAFTGGGTPSKANADFWNGNIPWVSPKDMKVSVINDTADHISASAVTESSTKLIDPGAVLVVVRSGILRRKIPVAINNVSVALNQDMKALESKGRLHNDYIFALIEGCQKILLTEWTKQGATVESIEYELIANSFIPIPPKDEQLAIVHFLTEANKNTDSAIAKARREISLLREYRTRLIADVVTGKLDVREAAANLPEETEVMETYDDVLAEDGLENGEVEDEQAGELEEEVLI